MFTDKNDCLCNSNEDQNKSNIATSEIDESNDFERSENEWQLFHSSLEKFGWAGKDIHDR